MSLCKNYRDFSFQQIEKLLIFTFNAEEIKFDFEF